MNKALRNIGTPVKVALDANCVIDAVDSQSHAFESMQRILRAVGDGKIALFISRHSLAEIHKTQPAVDLAASLAILPHWPIGSWDEQVAIWDQVVGTWDDARTNQSLQLEIRELGKAGTDIRDRGAYLDALRAGVEFFITSDRQLAADGPGNRLARRFSVRVLTPQALVQHLERQ